MSICILGIESSCDETAAALCQDGKIINNLIATQSIHERYGGVVPELASRAHMKNIIPTIKAALDGVGRGELSAIAYTQGPGLLGALLVGSAFAKSMAYALDIPSIPVNHMQAHVLAHFIEDPKPTFPFLCLTVSGGHTQIVKVTDFLSMHVIGQTRDDAVGEAFDKCAKLLGMGYPGGHMIDKLSQTGNPKKFQFPSSEIPEFDYSFSGIKTSFLYFLKKQQESDRDFIQSNINDLAASLQHNLVETLVNKLTKAAQAEGITQIAIAGGVSANSELRRRLSDICASFGWQLFSLKHEYCTDNAAMIATAGYYKLLEGQTGNLHDSPLPRMTI